jgi:hypothetical protein
VLRRWQRFALQIRADQAEALARLAAERGLLATSQRLRLHTAEQAVEGWSLALGGEVVPEPSAPLPHCVSSNPGCAESLPRLRYRAPALRASC